MASSAVGTMTPQSKWEVLSAEVGRRYPVLASVWLNAPARFGDAWIPEFVRNTEALYGEIGHPLSVPLGDALDGYAEFANDSMRNQVFYEKHGRYRATNYDDVRRTCYFDEEHMTRRYLPGMWLSHHLWPQHFHMLRGFETGILPRVRHASLFFEVGVGCGMYSKRTLELLPDIRGVGFDISRFALRYTERVMDAFGVRERYTLEERDIRHGFATPCDFLICQEVLEHLETPAKFCTWLFGLVRPGGHAYITAALNAAHSDHIHLFRTPAELEDMLRAAGFQPVHSQEECATGTKPRHLTPSLSAFFCQRPV
jgi:SAM-dependent methyltransferase